MSQFNIEFRKMPRDFGILPEAVREKIREIRPDYEQQWLDSTQHERDFAKWQEKQQATPATSSLADPAQHDTWYRVGDCIYIDYAAFIIDDISDVDGMITMRGNGGVFRQYTPEMFDALIYTNERNKQLRSDRLKLTTETSEPEPQKAETKPPQAELTQADRQNFRITDDNLDAGGAKAKYAMNVAAIRTLQDIEADKRLATPQEQEMLSRYVGWGCLPMAFDPDNSAWAKEYAELQNLLSPDEIDSARASTLNAHYTSPTVIKSIQCTKRLNGWASKAAICLNRQWAWVIFSGFCWTVCKTLTYTAWNWIP